MTMNMDSANNDDAVEIEFSSHVCADEVKINNSAVMMVEGDNLVVKDTAIGLANADIIEMKDCAVLIASGNELRGDITPVFTPVTAAVFGAAFGLSMFLLNSFFGLMKR